MPAGEGAASGPDTVMMQEDCRLDGPEVVIRPGIKRGANRRKAGEDVRAGSEILGRRPAPAAAGCRPRRLHRPDRSSRCSGRCASPCSRPATNWWSPAAPLAGGQVYDSNRYTLRALLAQLGAAVTDLGILPDRREVIRLALAVAAQQHDLLMSSGGVSSGEEDHVKAAVEALGRLHFWRLAIKPGRPIAMGQVDADGRRGAVHRPARQSRWRPWSPSCASPAR